MAGSIAVGMVGAAASSGKCCGVRALNTDNALTYVNWRNGAAQSYDEKGVDGKALAAVGRVGGCTTHGIRCGLCLVDYNAAAVSGYWTTGAANIAFKGWIVQIGSSLSARLALTATTALSAAFALSM